MKKIYLKTLPISIVLVALVSCSAEKDTPKTQPQVATTTLSNITLNTATSGGNVTSDGGDAISARGIVWNTTSSPTISLTTKTIDGAGLGNFSSSINNLLPSNTYFVRAYATNSIGTGYGNELSFTTGAIIVPTFSTTDITEITANTAISGGNIISDGGGAITARGVVWDTNRGATIALSTKTTDGTGTGVFTSTITGLIAGRTYFARAYVTNSSGTNYGNEVSFTTLFPIVTIGAQIWTARNLDVTTYSDGTLIPQVTDPSTWRSITTGAWCYYNMDSANGIIYGKMYNWNAVVGIWNEASKTDISQRKKLAPSGYHIPTENEWTTLTNFLGGKSIAGGKMKTTGTNLWNSPNTGASNISGFSGLPGGVCSSNFSFMLINQQAFWWSSTEYLTTYAMSYSLSSEYSDCSGGGGEKTWYGYVRCIKD